MKKYAVDIYLFSNFIWTIELEANDEEELIESIESNFGYDILELEK